VWTILSFGNKDPEWVSTIASHYEKLLKPAYKIKHINCVQKSLSNTQENNLLQKSIPKNNYIIGLDIYGKQQTSDDFATNLRKIQLIQRQICFIIGGSDGLNTASKNMCHELWSLSKLTMPHKLAKVILIEQLYRASCILTNHPYHK
jgi:23S rRNA (pseudouridine1915-N3)-methyltransferase